MAEIERTIGRRQFCQALFVGLPAELVLTYLIAGCGKVSPSGSPEFKKTLEESKAYLTSEIRANPGISSLPEYGDEKILTFIFHAYNVYVHSTNSPTGVKTFQELTDLGDNATMKATLDKDVYGVVLGDPDFYQGRTYLADPSFQIKPNQRRIMINREASELNKNGVTKLGGSRILCFLALVASHEPFHFDSPLQEVNKELQAAVSSFRYTHQSGLALYGDNLNTGDRVIHFGTLDELATRYLHRRLIGIQIPDLQEVYSDEEITWTDFVAKKIFTPLGYETPEKILKLQRGGGFMEILRCLTEAYGGDEHSAYMDLVAINNGLFSNTGISKKQNRDLLIT